MFTDVVGSTRLIEAFGDAAWVDLRRWHDEARSKEPGMERYANYDTFANVYNLTLRLFLQCVGGPTTIRAGDRAQHQGAAGVPLPRLRYRSQARCCSRPSPRTRPKDGYQD